MLEEKCEGKKCLIKAIFQIIEEYNRIRTHFGGCQKFRFKSHPSNISQVWRKKKKAFLKTILFLSIFHGKKEMNVF